MEDEIADHRLSILLLGFLVGATGAFFLAVQGDLANAANDRVPPADAPASDTIRPGTVLVMHMMPPAQATDGKSRRTATLPICSATGWTI